MHPGNGTWLKIKPLVKNWTRHVSVASSGGPSLRGNSLEAHGCIPAVPPALKYMNELMDIF